MTNRELIKRNFKFEQYTILDQGDALLHSEVTSYEEDMIIEGSTVFNNGAGFLDTHASSSGKIPHLKGKLLGTKDITNEANSFRNQKGLYF